MALKLCLRSFKTKSQPLIICKLPRQSAGSSCSVSRPVMCLSESEKQIVTGIIIPSPVSHTPTLLASFYFILTFCHDLVTFLRITPR